MMGFFSPFFLFAPARPTAKLLTMFLEVSIVTLSLLVQADPTDAGILKAVKFRHDKAQNTSTD